MARSNLPRRGSGPANPETEKSKLNPNLGVYTFIDEDGNVKQIKKEKKNITMYYPNAPSKIDSILPDFCVIGIYGGNSECTSSEGIAMGIGDNLAAYANYN